MFDVLKCFFAASAKLGPVFVVGTGRSGTHWLGYAIGDHPEVRATVEIEPFQMLSIKMAFNPKLEKWLLPLMIYAYKWQIAKSGNRIYLDKSHPNLWIAEKLKKAFPKALFLGIERNPYAVVASMKKHKGVSKWHSRWKEFPIPNRFLGITNDLARNYDDMPFASQCALRWKAHYVRMNALKGTLGESLMVISYEDFAANPEKTINGLQNFLGLKVTPPVPVVNAESIEKWKNQLSEEEVTQIFNIVGFSPENG